MDALHGAHLDYPTGFLNVNVSRGGVKRNKGGMDDAESGDTVSRASVSWCARRLEKVVRKDGVHRVGVFAVVVCRGHRARCDGSRWRGVCFVW